MSLRWSNQAACAPQQRLGLSAEAGGALTKQSAFAASRLRRDNLRMACQSTFALRATVDTPKLTPKGGA